MPMVGYEGSCQPSSSCEAMAEREKREELVNTCGTHQLTALWRSTRKVMLGS